MKLVKPIAALAGVAAAALTLTPMAAAQNTSTWELDGASVPAGGTVVVFTDRTARCDGEVTSPGLRAPIKFKYEAQSVWVGYGLAVDTPGTYDASATCGGRTTTHKLTIKPRQAGDDLLQWGFDKAEAEAGGTITVRMNRTTTCVEATAVTSPGFVAPIEFNRFDDADTVSGQGKVIDTPGTYQATMNCGGQPVTRTFTIKAKAPSAPKPEQKPKPQVVKPKGAPQTGGGATA